MKINKKALLLGTMAFVLVAASGIVKMCIRDRYQPFFVKHSIVTIAKIAKVLNIK